MGATTKEFVKAGIDIIDNMISDLQNHRRKLAAYLRDLEEHPEVYTEFP